LGTSIVAITALVAVLITPIDCKLIVKYAVAPFGENRGTKLNGFGPTTSFVLVSTIKLPPPPNEKSDMKAKVPSGVKALIKVPGRLATIVWLSVPMTDIFDPFPPNEVPISPT
jgi:hypothetical protein